MRQNNDEERSQDKKYFMTQIDELKQEKKQIINLFDSNVKDKVQWEVSKYKSELEEKIIKLMTLKKKTNTILICMKVKIKE